MFRKGTENPWFFSSGFNMMVDFCVWVLESDGLRVPPFDRHDDGDGALRARGFDAQGWRVWADDVVALQARVDRVPFQNPDGSIADVWAKASNPPIVWAGDAAVGELLVDLWDRYGPLSNVRREWEKLPHKSGLADAHHTLWHDLAPYHAQLPPLRVHLVDYLWPVEYLVPPASVIMGVGSEPPNGARFRADVLHAAEGLARQSRSS